MFPGVTAALSDQVFVVEGVPAAEALARAQEQGATHIAVVQQGRPTALFRRDGASAHGAPEVLCNVPTVNASDTLAGAGRRLLSAADDALAVTDDSGRFVGVATRDSVLRALLEDLSREGWPEDLLLRSLVENVPELIALLNTDGTFAYVNRTVPGLTREEVLGRHAADFVPADRRAELRALLDDVAATGRAREYEIPAAGPHGTTALYSCRVSAVRRNETTVGLIAVSSDITERRRTEEQACSLHNELAHMARISTMGEMASGLAHELNQPLAAIVAYADACQELVESERMSREQLREVLRSISSQAERAGKIIHRLRQLVRKSDPVRTAMCLNEAVREVAALLDLETRRAGVSLRLDLDAHLPEVCADLVQIQQVVVNLMRNGIEAMSDTPAGRRELHVATRRVSSQEVEVAVCDSGRGIDPATMERLFEPFFTTKPEGLGMGLSISRGIVAAHGGRLVLKANSAAGATVHCTLPAMSAGGGAA
ncbi:MAG: ATP-binding protein [Planctomycetaceae bacterium]